MTAIFRSGIEVEPATFAGGVGEFGTELAGASFIQRSSTVKRSGTYSLRFFGQSYVTMQQFSATGIAMRAYFHITASPGAAGQIMGAYNATIAPLIQLGTDRKLRLFDSALIATSEFTVPIGTFDQYVELWVDVATKIVCARYNGVEWARATRTAWPADPLYNVWWGPSSSVMAGCDLYVDDLAVNTLAGEFNNGWPGASAGGVLTTWPTADAEHAASWVVNGAASLWDALNDPTPDDAATYIVETAHVASAGAGVFFSNWPVVVPASAVMFGVRGQVSVAPTPLTFAFRDPQNFGPNQTATWTVGGWQTIYPALTAERAVDGSRRLLNNGYLFPTGSVGRGRVVLVRAETTADIYVTSLWMTADFPLALTAPPVVPPYSFNQPTVLVTLEP